MNNISGLSHGCTRAGAGSGWEGTGKWWGRGYVAMVGDIVWLRHRCDLFRGVSLVFGLMNIIAREEAGGA